MSTRAVVLLLLDEDRRALLAAKRVAAAVARAADAAARSLAAGGDVVFIGAGTSGRLGVLEAAECPPTFGTDAHRIRGVMAGGRRSVFRSREGAEDDANAGRREGEKLLRGDLLIGISASAVTPFVRAALAAARRRGAASVLLTCVSARGLTPLADVVIAIPAGPEVLTGSTRLKAGSATKAVLNALTTAAMVRLGKVYQNWMVDLRPSSAKLRDRERRIVAAAARVSAEEATLLLQRAKGEVKTAIVMGLRGVPAAQARRLVTRARGHVRSALVEGS